MANTSNQPKEPKDKASLEIEKLEIEKEKLQEELRQLKVPLYKKPAYLGVFLPVCATLVVAILNFKRISDEQLVKDLAEVKAEKEKVVQEKLALGNSLLEIEKNDLNRQKEETQKEIDGYRGRINDYTARIKHYEANILNLKESHLNQKKTLESIDASLKERNDEVVILKAAIDKDSTSILWLDNLIRTKQQNVKDLESKVQNLSVKSQLLAKVSKDLKGILIRFYTDWKVDRKKGDNEQLRMELTTVRQELRNVYERLNDKDKFTSDFENMDKSIASLINDKNAFTKVAFLKNIGYVDRIEKTSNALIEKLQGNELLSQTD